MTERMRVNADLEFVKTLLGSGAEDLKYCYQCSTCTVVCPLTPDGNPFPRKEMIYAQWGLKEKLVKSLDSWLCVNCNDCSSHCPRGANPGDVMNTLRSLSVRYFSVPSFIAKWANTPSLIWILFLVPFLIIGAVILVLHGGTGFGFLEGRVVFSKMLPVPVIDSIFIPAAAFAGITAFLGLSKFIRAMREEYPPTSAGEPFFKALIGVKIEILSHAKFKDCGPNKSRQGAHLLTMYGFIGLFITTTLVGIAYYLNAFGLDITVTPYDFFHPVKLLGNSSGSLALLGCVLIVARRWAKGKVGHTTIFDWTFIWVLLLTIATGFLSQVFRVLDTAGLAYFTYFIHLIFVFFLLAYASHTKFAHIFYRTAAMIYARTSGRNIIQPPEDDTQAEEVVN